jgi:flagellar motor switch protein FliM
MTAPAAGPTDVSPSSEVALYNFLRPPRITRERRVQLSSIGERFALSMQSMLSLRLRVPADVSCTFEQATLGEFVLAIADPCASFVFDLGGTAGGQAAVDLTTDLGFYIVDRVFGGAGEAARLDRALTQLESSVVRGVVEKMLGLFREAWCDHVPFAPQIVGFESNPDMLQIVGREDNVLVTNLDVRAGQFSGAVRICLPLVALESFLVERTGGRMPASGRRVTVSQRQSVEGVVRTATVRLAGRFPPVRLSAREVAGFRIGQIIQTTQATDQPIELHVNGTPRFLGVLGQYRRMLGVRITQAMAGAPLVTGAVGRTSRGRISG